MIDQTSWSRGVGVVKKGLSSSLHCAVASINEDGTPHVTPIGSLQITGPTTAMYFDVFNNRLSRNVDRDPRVVVLAVNSSKLFWLRMLVRGRFLEYPGVRLVGTVGPKRKATSAEQERFRRRVRSLHRLKGYPVLWSDVGHARDVTFTSIESVRLGKSTSGLG